MKLKCSLGYKKQRELPLARFICQWHCHGVCVPDDAPIPLAQAADAIPLSPGGHWASPARALTPRERAARQAESAAIQKRTRREHALERAEDYVEAIADLIENRGEARATDLAAMMGVSHVTVIRTVARLQKAGYVTTEPYRAIFLTASGRRLAGRSRARHRLVVEFLEAIGVPPETARADAEGIEHHVSRETLKIFEAFLKQTRGK